MKTLVKFYKKNGNVFCGSKILILDAIGILEKEGYRKYYQGLDYSDNQVTIVGIDENNTVGLKNRRENGLLNAVEITI